MKANDNTEDSYFEETIPKKRGYESNLTDNTEQVAPRAALSNLFTQVGKWYRRTVNIREGQSYY